MKMFMATLEGKTWPWYERLTNGSLYSLVDFHVAFYEMYKECHPSLLLVKDCCKHCVSFIEYLENCYEDDEFMDVEILEALHDKLFHHQGERIACLLDENETQQEFIYENYDTSSEFDENLQQTCQYFDHQGYENHCKQ